MKKQKNTLISYLFFYGGFLLSLASMIFVIIYTVVYKKYEGDIIHLMCLVFCLTGAILPFFASKFNIFYYFSMYKPEYKLLKSLAKSGFIQGVPNNDNSDFLMINILNVQCLELSEQSGMFIGENNGRKIVLDMRGWIFKEKYVYELFQTFYIIKYVTKNKLPKKMIYKPIISKDISETTLIIKKRGKINKYYLAYEGKIRANRLLNLKNHKKSRFIENNKFSIKDYYDFNIENEKK